MTREQIWAERVREWRASGTSMSDFSRGKEFTASGLAYWIKRLAPASARTPGAKAPVRLARVVTSSEPVPMVTEARSPSGVVGSVVLEVVAVRAEVPAELASTQLDAVVASIARGLGGGAR